MAFGNVPKSDSNTIPIGSVYTPDGSTGLVALQGSIIVNTDGLGNVSAPVATHHAAGVVSTAASSAHTVTLVTPIGPLTVGPYAELAVDANISAVSGTSPTLTFFVDRIGADNVAYNIWSSSVVSTVSKVSASIGSGFSTNQSFGLTVQFRWTIAGTTPSFTFSYSIIGK